MILTHLYKLIPPPPTISSIRHQHKFPYPNNQSTLWSIHSFYCCLKIFKNVYEYQYSTIPSHLELTHIYEYQYSSSPSNL